MMSANTFCEFGPMSKIMSSSPTSLMSLITASASVLNEVATTTSVGKGTEPPLASIEAMIFLASSTKSASTKDLPTLWPWAIKKVLAMPPPTINWSTFWLKLSKMVSLVDTLLPPTIATTGGFGCSVAWLKASSSADNNKPAQATGANCATAWVEACARWAAPKASNTNTSHKAA